MGGEIYFNPQTNTKCSSPVSDTGTKTVPSPYAGTYGWLYDRTRNCTSYGCTTADLSHMYFKSIKGINMKDTYYKYKYCIK